MVSASHNPADDNGLKVLDARGMKLDDEVEDELEALVWRADELASPTNAGLGREVDARAQLRHYREHRLGLARRTRSELRVALDCANGSGCEVAPEILAGTGATVRTHFDQPDGININVDCGATVPGTLAAIVAGDGVDVGFALDGDADRCVAVDERGQIVDGDQLIGIIAQDRLSRGVLSASTVVLSVLSNGGLARAVEEAGGRVVRTPVGDKYILEAMQVSGAGLGGEKSGHVIMPEHTTSSDGIVTALEVLDILARTGKPLSELAATFRSTRSSSARSTFVTGSNGRRTCSWHRPCARPKPSSTDTAGSWSAPPAPSRRCGSWSKARTPCASRSSPTPCRRSRASD